VAATANGEIQPVVTCEIHCSHHVRNLLSPDHCPRPPVEHAVVNAAGLVITTLIRGDDRAPYLITQLIYPHRLPPVLQVLSPDAVNPLVPRTVCAARTGKSLPVRAHFRSDPGRHERMEAPEPGTSSGTTAQTSDLEAGAAAAVQLPRPVGKIVVHTLATNERPPGDSTG
jgi:hypothetical protein